jgi:uncharacterized protein DUF3298
MSIHSSRRTSILGFCLLACGLGGPLLAATPDVSIKNKFVEISVEIDNALKAYPGLFDNCFTEGKSWAQKSSNDAAKEQRSDPSLFRDRPKWSYDRSYTLRSVVVRYVSIVRADDTYEGGAHPNHVVDTILWDGDAQKRISVRPFFTETADNGPTMTALARLARLAVAAEKISRDIPAGSDDKLRPNMTPEKYLRQDTFIADGIKPSLLQLGPLTLAPSTERAKSSGLTFHYSPYAVGPYAEGPYTVFVPWTAFQQFLSDTGRSTFAGTRPKGDDKF